MREQDTERECGDGRVDQLLLPIRLRLGLGLLLLRGDGDCRLLLPLALGGHGEREHDAVEAAGYGVGAGRLGQLELERLVEPHLAGRGLAPVGDGEPALAVHANQEVLQLQAFDLLLFQPGRCMVTVSRMKEPFSD